jgi:plastocyanin
MATTNVSPSSTSGPPSPLRRRSTLDILIIAGLLAAAANYALAQLIGRAIIPPALAYLIMYIIFAGIVALPWRWSLLVPLLLLPLMLIGEWTSGFPGYALTHPADRLPFVSEVLEYALILMVIGVCVVKLVQMLRHETIHTPRWMAPALTALAGLVLGAVLVGMTAQASPGATTASIHMTSDHFAPDIVALHTGGSLTITNDSTAPHILSNGSWSQDSHPAPAAESGAPVVKNIDVTSGNATIGPFTTAGVYHIYCTVHPGMTLTIVVQ